MYNAKQQHEYYLLNKERIKVRKRLEYYGKRYGNREDINNILNDDELTQPLKLEKIKTILRNDKYIEDLKKIQSQFSQKYKDKTLLITAY
jgi:hypothetical protein